MWTAKYSLCIFHKKKLYIRQKWLKSPHNNNKTFFSPIFISLHFFVCCRKNSVYRTFTGHMSALHEQKNSSSQKEVWGNEKKGSRMWISWCTLHLLSKSVTSYSCPCLFFLTLLSLLGVNLTPFGIFLVFF